jgi:hypothetical protein
MTMRFPTRLTLATAILLLVSGAATSVAAFVGGHRAPVNGRPPLALLFTNHDGTPCVHPCLLGIRPDTLFEQALDILEHHPLTQGFEHQYFANRLVIATGRDMTITLNDSRAGLLVDVYYLPPRKIGDLISVIGPPESARMIELIRSSIAVVTDYYIYLFYDEGKFVVEIRTDGDRLGLDRTFGVLRLIGTQFHLSGESSPWRGFAAWNRYR